MIKTTIIYRQCLLVLFAFAAVHVNAQSMESGYQTNPIHNLTGRYYQGQNFGRLIMTRQDRVIDFDWQTRSVSNAIDLSDYFSVRWQGYIKTLADESYTFYIRADAGVRLWVNDQKVIDTWGGGQNVWHEAKVNLRPQRWYPIRLDYREDDGDAYVSLHWSSDTMAKTLVPSKQLSSVRLVK